MVKHKEWLGWAFSKYGGTVRFGRLEIGLHYWWGV